MREEVPRLLNQEASHPDLMFPGAGLWLRQELYRRAVNARVRPHQTSAMQACLLQRGHARVGRRRAFSVGARGARGRGLRQRAGGGGHAPEEEEREDTGHGP